MSMRAFANDIALRLHHRGVLIEREHANVAGDLREIAAVKPDEMKALFATAKLEIVSSYGFQPVEQNKPFAYADGVAIIPIHGMLINRMSWSYSFATGYNFIRSQMNAALDDDDVKLIVYDINSSGGIASGCGELSKEIFESRDTKPSLSVVDSRCYSAAYFLGSAASRIVVTPSGGVGSIGCAAMHVDMSGMLEQDGVKIEFIFAGAEKVDGNSYEPLSARARESISRDVNYHYGLFVEAVARQRDLSEDDVRATEARCFLPPEALELGLIDGIKTPVEAVAELFNELTSDSDVEDEIMDRTPAASTTAAAPTPVAPAPGLTAEAVAKMVADGISADRSRQAAIRTSAEAKGREALADHLALNTGMSADEAIAVLTAAPKVAEAAPAPVTEGNARQVPDNHFAHAMNNTPNPNVGADPETGATGPGGSDPANPMATANRLLGTYAAFTGQKIPQIGGRA